MSNQGTPPTPPAHLQTLANRGIQPRFGELVQSCRKLVMNRLAEHLTGVFAQVDDTLFECAEKAENNQVQTLFFDNMREIRRQRPQIERSLSPADCAEFLRFPRRQTQATRQPQRAGRRAHGLVQNEDYEESLQVTNMVSRVKARCAQPLFALEQRLALLNNGQKLGEDINPFGPQMIAQAFRDALAPCPFPLRIKVILYTLFDTHVMQSLDGIYSRTQPAPDCGGRAAQSQIHRTANATCTPATRSRSAAASTAETPAEAAQALDSQRTQGHASGADRRQAPSAAGEQRSGRASSDWTSAGRHPATHMELLGSLSQPCWANIASATLMRPLLGGTRSIASFTPREATSTYSASALLDALNRMQQAVGQRPVAAPASPTAGRRPQSRPATAAGGPQRAPRAAEGFRPRS